MSSSRLPGKVLEFLDGVPMIVFMLKRVARARAIDQFVVATSTERSDDVLEREIIKHGYHCFRGDLADVLGRYVGAARCYQADVVVRLTGDCPLVDPDLIDLAVATLVEHRYEYVSNVDPPSFPNGLDIEAFTRAALFRANEEAKSPKDREHVTPYIRRRKDLFVQSNLTSQMDLAHLRWTVDHADDLEFVRALTSLVSPLDPIVADRFDYLRALEANVAVIPKNRHNRNEGYLAESQVKQSDEKVTKT